MPLYGLEKPGGLGEFFVRHLGRRGERGAFLDGEGVGAQVVDRQRKRRCEIPVDKGLGVARHAVDEVDGKVVETDRFRVEDSLTRLVGRMCASQALQFRFVEALDAETDAVDPEAFHPRQPFGRRAVWIGLARHLSVRFEVGAQQIEQGGV